VDWRLPDADELAGLYDPLPIALDPVFAALLGVRADLAGAVADDPEDVLDRLADRARAVPPGMVAAVTAAVIAGLDRLGRDVGDIDLPSGVRTIGGDVVDADDAFVLDEPWLAQVVPATRLVPGGVDPALVGRVLDLPMASQAVSVEVVSVEVVSVEVVSVEVVSVEVVSTAVVSSSIAPDADVPSADWTAQAQGRLDRAAAAVGLRLAEVEVILAPELRALVDGRDRVTVRWWAQDGRFWVDGSAEACGRAVAWAAGSWSGRHRAIAAAGNDWTALAEDAVG
jgi:hypothetical protein